MNHRKIFEAMLARGQDFAPAVIYTEEGRPRAISVLPAADTKEEFHRLLATAMFPYVYGENIDGVEIVTDTVLRAPDFELGEQEALIVLKSSGDVTAWPYGRDDTGRVAWKEPITDGAQVSGYLPDIIAAADLKRGDVTHPLPVLLAFLAEDGFLTVMP